MEAAKDTIQLVGALGLGGVVLVYNLRSPPYTPGSLIAPLALAGIWYLFTPIAICMLSGKSFTLCTFKSATDEAADLAGDLLNGAANAAKGAAKALGGIYTGVVDNTLGNTIGSFIGPPPPDSADAQTRFDYEKNKAFKMCKYPTLVPTVFIANQAGLQTASCDRYDELKSIVATREEILKYGQLTAAEAWDCRYNKKCVNKLNNLSADVFEAANNTTQIMIGGTVIGEAVKDENGKIVGMLPPMLQAVPLQ